MIATVIEEGMGWRNIQLVASPLVYDFGLFLFRTIIQPLFLLLLLCLHATSTTTNGYTAATTRKLLLVWLLLWPLFLLSLLLACEIEVKSIKSSISFEVPDSSYNTRSKALLHLDTCLSKIRIIVLLLFSDRLPWYYCVIVCWGAEALDHFDSSSSVLHQFYSLVLYFIFFSFFFVWV